MFRPNIPLTKKQLESKHTFKCNHIECGGRLFFGKRSIKQHLRMKPHHISLVEEVSREHPVQQSTLPNGKIPAIQNHGANYLPEGNEEHLADNGSADDWPIDHPLSDDGSPSPFTDNLPETKKGIKDNKSGDRLFYSQKWKLELEIDQIESSTSKTQSSKKYDLGLLNMFIDDDNNQSSDCRSIPTNLQAEIDLMHLFNETNGASPGYLFDHVVGWMLKWITPAPEGSKYSIFRKKEAVLKDIRSVANYERMYPTTSTVFLPHINHYVDVTTFDPVAVIYDLLTNPVLDKDENYLFEGHCPLDRPDGNPTRLKDVNTGTRYINSWDKLAIDPHDLPFPIQFFIDKANVTWNARISVEALMIQLCIHNQDCRYKPISFRNLGIIPRLDNLPYRSNEALLKMKDYHVLVDIIMEPLRKIMNNTKGLPFILRYDNWLWRTVMKPYVLIVLGDTPGHNLLAGKFCGPETKLKCRYCNCPSNQLQNPLFKFRRIRKSQFICENNSQEYMRINFSMYHIDNCLEKLEYGSTLHGPLGLLLGEIVHAVQLGCHSRLHEGVVTTTLLCEKQQARKEKIEYDERVEEGWYNHKKVNHESLIEDSDDSESDNPPPGETQGDTNGDNQSEKGYSSHHSSGSDSDQDGDSVDSFRIPGDEDEDANASDNGDSGENDNEDKSNDGNDSIDGDLDQKPTSKRKTYAFGGIPGKRIDTLGRLLGRQIQRQSERDFPPLHFSKGLINKAKTTASEAQGLLLLFLIILCSEYGKKNLTNRIGAMRMAYIIETIESFICFEEFCKDKNGFYKSIIPAFKRNLVDMKQMFRYVVHRKAGKGLNLVKWHLLDHLPDDCLAMASPANLSGGPGEGNQRTNKAAGRKTQLNSDTFDHQQSVKLDESLAIKTAKAHVSSLETIHTSQSKKIDQPAVKDNDGQIGSGYHYAIRVYPSGSCAFVYDGDAYSKRGLFHKKKSNGGSCLSSLYPTVATIMRIVKERVDIEKPLHPLYIPVFTELKRLDDSDVWQLYRSDPILNHEKKSDKTSRADWAWCGWSHEDRRRKDELIAAKILCFLENTSDCRELFPDLAIDGEPCMILQSLDRQQSTMFDTNETLNLDDMQHPASRLLFRGVLECEFGSTTIPQMYVRTCDMIVWPAAVIRDFNPSFHGKSPRIKKYYESSDEQNLEYILIRHRKSWSDVFQAVCTNTFGKTRRVVPDFTQFFEQVVRDQDISERRKKKERELKAAETRKRKLEETKKKKQDADKKRG
jgi:hypothetical protein